MYATARQFHNARVLDRGMTVGKGIQNDFHYKLESIWACDTWSYLRSFHCSIGCIWETIAQVKAQQPWLDNWDLTKKKMIWRIIFLHARHKGAIQISPQTKKFSYKNSFQVHLTLGLTVGGGRVGCHPLAIFFLLIITITKLSNLIGYQLPWFQP